MKQVYYLAISHGSLGEWAGDMSAIITKSRTYLGI